jgi:hypothetical protein
MCSSTHVRAHTHTHTHTRTHARAHTHTHTHIQVTIGRLFILMGREHVEVDTAPAGMVVGILGLGDHVQKSATLSSTTDAPSLAPMYFVGAPIVRVALETESIADMPALRRGLKLLHQADPGVEVLIQGSGELVSESHAAYWCTHAHTRTHTHTHTHRRVHTHTHTHRERETYKNRRVNTHTHTDV